MATEVDVIVLGVGTGGEDLSLQLLDAGLDVVGIEPNLVGGECPYWACVPSKMMIHAAKQIHGARRIDGTAGHADVVPDWAPVAARVREATGAWDDSAAVKRFGQRGGRLVHAPGRITSPRTVTAAGETYSARRGIVIATGSRAAIPPIPGLAEVDYWTTHAVIQLESPPQSLIILGGGAVGCEMAQLLGRFGVHVTLIQAGERLLPHEEPEASGAVANLFAAEGITVRTGAAAERIEKKDGAIAVSLAGGDEILGERLLVATGRKANLDDIGLEAAGLDPTTRYLSVDERLRATDGIWALGDVTGKTMFTHVALYHSAIIAADILGHEQRTANYHALPRVTFTDPEVAAVGMTESEAVAAGLDVSVAVKPLPATFRGWIDAVDEGFIKLIADRRSDRLVGATVVGPHSGEALSMLSLALHAQLPLSQLRSMMYAFPTFHGAIGEALGAYGRGITTVLDPGYEGFRASAAPAPGAKTGTGPSD